MSEIASSRWQKAHVAKGTVIAFIECRYQKFLFGNDLSEWLSKHAAALGYGFEIFRREEFSSSAKLQRVLRNRGITDIILGPAFQKFLTVELDWEKFICVRLTSGIFRHPPFHTVVRDHFNAVVLAWQKAVSHGYRRIGIVLVDHPIPLIDDLLRISAARACQMELFPHLPVIPPLRAAALPEPVHGKDFVAWVKREKPDVIIGFTGFEYYLFRDEFGHATPYISLHRDTCKEFSGIADISEGGAREAINLLHFCRRTHQWGIPEQRIDHTIEPIWHEGNSLPQKEAV